MDLYPAIQALLIFTALTAVLAVTIVVYRSFIIISGKTSADSWTRDAGKWQDASVMKRVQHAHLNCLENLPLFAIVVLVAAYIGKIAVIDELACVFVALRLTQVAVHIVAVNHWMVMLRASFYFAQMGLLGYWLLKLTGCI